MIANVFFLAGFIESWGRGFEKIKEECEKTKTPLPEIKISSGGVMIHCTPSENYMKVLKKLKKNGNDTLNDTLKIILKVIKSNNKITQMNISEETGLSIITVKRSIDSLKSLGYIERVGSKKAGYWKILK